MRYIVTVQRENYDLDIEQSTNDAGHAYEIFAEAKQADVWFAEVYDTYSYARLFMYARGQ